MEFLIFKHVSPIHLLKRIEDVAYSFLNTQEGKQNK